MNMKLGRSDLLSRADLITLTWGPQAIMFINIFRIKIRRNDRLSAGQQNYMFMTVNKKNRLLKNVRFFCNESYAMKTYALAFGSG